ncbi:hypothetical protein L5515_017173 [Caenorhabditis briggsae]|uniref:Uncharacterized protein n=1 Tax=Caenorhabditis briggsae TaxID=6238 RepID=A0AAE9FEU5_CAEBR|nr:hypothetical protein L5515_017173 [Caenorhabditis briggsae]
MPSVGDVVYANTYPAVLLRRRGRTEWHVRYLSAQENSQFHCDESRMKAVHVEDTVQVVENLWGLLEDGLREARRLIEADPSKGGWGSADIKLRRPTQSRTHGVTRLGLQRHGAGIEAQGALNGLAPAAANVVAPAQGSVVGPSTPAQKAAKKRSGDGDEGASAKKFQKTTEMQEEEEEVEAKDTNSAEEPAQQQSLFSKYWETMVQWLKK